MSEGKIRVLVCGVTFGQMYIKAINNLEDKYELAAILSNGSPMAKKLSEEFRVPLYLKVQDIPSDCNINLACVVIRSTVVGGKGTEIALELLERGISVVQEQPVHYDDLVKCLKIATKSKITYYINNFYRDLDVMQELFKVVRRIKKECKIISIEAVSGIQVLFPLIDIIGELLDGFNKWEFKEGSVCEDYPFRVIGGKIHDIPILLQIQNQINSVDPDNDALVLHRLSIIFEKGTLILTETNGGIVWIPRIRVLRKEVDRNVPLEIENFPPQEMIASPQYSNLNEMFDKGWPASIERTLINMCSKIENGVIDVKAMQRQMSGCKVWIELGNILGTSEECPEIVKYKGSLKLK